MAWRWSGDKPLSEPMVVSLLTHICVIRPQWVKLPLIFLTMKVIFLIYCLLYELPHGFLFCQTLQTWRCETSFRYLWLWELTNFGLVMPMVLHDQHWFRYWLVLWHHAITWTSIDFSEMGSSVIHQRAVSQEMLTHWGRDKIDAISQTPFSNAFSWMKMNEFRLAFHWSLFLRFESTIFHHWFR